jgi:hypothetical protein
MLYILAEVAGVALLAQSIRLINQGGPVGTVFGVIGTIEGVILFIAGSVSISGLSSAEFWKSDDLNCGYSTGVEVDCSDIRPV